MGFTERFGGQTQRRVWRELGESWRGGGSTLAFGETLNPQERALGPPRLPGEDGPAGCLEGGWVLGEGEAPRVGLGGGSGTCRENRKTASRVGWWRGLHAEDNGG